MADAFKKLQAEYDKFLPDLKTFSEKECEAKLKTFLDLYKKTVDEEEKVAATLKGARENGVAGDKVEDFKKDKGFKDAYKIYDKLLDELDKIQKTCIQMRNEAAMIGKNMALLDKQIDKDFKGSKELKVELLRKVLQKGMKDMQAASQLYDKKVDKTTDMYVTKWEKQVARILALAPPAPKPIGASLPDDLSDDKLVKIEKEMQVAAKKIDAFCKKALALSKTKPFGEKAYLMAGKELKNTEPLLEVMKKTVDNYKKLLAANAKSIKEKEVQDKDNKVKETFPSIDRFVTKIETHFKNLTKFVNDTTEKVDLAKSQAENV